MANINYQETINEYREFIEGHGIDNLTDRISTGLTQAKRRAL
jgi:hypothetical protein